MRKNINIEVEGQELILKNKAGDYVIIPKKYRTKVQGMIKDNCHGCIDSLVETLPAMSDYAQDGTVFPNEKQPIVLITPSGRKSKIQPIQKYQSSGAVKRDFLKEFLKEFGINTRAVSDNATTIIPTPQGNKTLATPLETPLTPEQLNEKVRRKKVADSREIQRRKDNISKSNSSKGFIEQARNSAVGDKMRFFPNDPNSFIDEYINPFKWIGDMADNLGHTFADPNSSITDKAIALGTPLLVGAIGSNLGSPKISNNQFLNNVFNPLPIPMNSTKILNKIDNNSFYRQIGKEGYEDAIKTGVIRSNPVGEYAGKAPYFVEGKDFDNLYSTGAGAGGKKPEYIFEMPQLKNPEEMSAFRVNQQEGYAPYVAGSKEIPISQGKIYRLNNKNEYELIDATKVGSKVLNKTDDVVKNLPKLEQIPLDFRIEDFLKNISSTERKNMEIVKKGNAYFRELDNPESLKRLKEFGDEYNIDLLDAYKKAEERWDYGRNFGKHDKFQVKKTDEEWYGLSTTKWDYEDELRLIDLKQKFGEDSKQVKDFYKELSQKKSINYISDAAPLERYEKTIWHELSHDINKSIIDSSPKLQEDIKNIFIEKGTADLNKVKKGREYVAKDFYTKKDEVLKDLDNPEKLQKIGEDEFDYVTRPTETWAFLSTNLRQDLKNTGVIKNYNEILTPEKLEKAIKNGNTVFSRFEPYIKDKDAFIKLFNKMTLSIAPAALYLQSQNQNKSEQ